MRTPMLMLMLLTTARRTAVSELLLRVLGKCLDPPSSSVPFGTPPPSPSYCGSYHIHLMMMLVVEVTATNFFFPICSCEDGD